MRNKVLIATFIISFLMIPFLTHAEVYKWVDDKGTIHFTDDYSNIPEKYLPLAEVQESPEEGPAPISKEKVAPVPAPRRSESPELETPRLFSGLISGVDNSERSIAVTADGREMVFAVSEETIIRTDTGKRLPFSELRNGGPVMIEYIEKGGELQARSVTVSILEAGATNAVGDNQAPGPGQLENPGKAQQGVWDDQQSHQTFPDGTPTKPSQFKLPKK